MAADSDRAVVVGWGGTIVDDRGRHARLMPGVRELLSGARAAGIPAIVLTRTAVGRVAVDARRLRIGSLLSMVIADTDDVAGELRRLRRDFPRLAYVGGVDVDVAAARSAGVLAFGYSGGWHAGSRLRAAGAEAVTSRLDRSFALRVTERRLFVAADTGS